MDYSGFKLRPGEDLVHESARSGNDIWDGLRKVGLVPDCRWNDTTDECRAIANAINHLHRMACAERADFVAANERCLKLIRQRDAARTGAERLAAQVQDLTAQLTVATPAPLVSIPWIDGTTITEGDARWNPELFDCIVDRVNAATRLHSLVAWGAFDCRRDGSITFEAKLHNSYQVTAFVTAWQAYRAEHPKGESK